MAKNKPVGVHGTDEERGVKPEGGAGQKKTECPISRERFNTKAAPVELKIGNTSIIAGPKEFSSGSFGFHANEKATVMIDGVPTKVQANIILTVIGSKDQPYPEGK